MKPVNSMLSSFVTILLMLITLTILPVEEVVAGSNDKACASDVVCAKGQLCVQGFCRVGCRS
ncbi:MAG: hypothetical protein ACI8P9_001026 [Parasphingorhabdus sp.]|jgi:hypothetical protein